MKNFIKSFEQKLVAFDQESTEKALRLKKKKERDKIADDIFWARFKKFKIEFERLVCTDIKELLNVLKAPLMQRNIVLKNESHLSSGNRVISTNFSIYTLISISARFLKMDERWEKSPFLLLKGNSEKNIIGLYNCNQERAINDNYFEANVRDNLIMQFNIENYKFSLLEPLIEEWLNANLSRFLDDNDFIANNKIV